MPNQGKECAMDIVHDMDEDELLEEWDVLFSPQHTFESFIRMCEGPMYLRKLNAKVEKMIKALDGSMTKQYKNK